MIPESDSLSDRLARARAAAFATRQASLLPAIEHDGSVVGTHAAVLESLRSPELLPPGVEIEGDDSQMPLDPEGSRAELLDAILTIATAWRIKLAMTAKRTLAALQAVDRWDAPSPKIASLSDAPPPIRMLQTLARGDNPGIVPFILGPASKEGVEEIHRAAWESLRELFELAYQADSTNLDLSHVETRSRLVESIQANVRTMRAWHDQVLALVHLIDESMDEEILECLRVLDTAAYVEEGRSPLCSNPTRGPFRRSMLTRARAALGSWPTPSEIRLIYDDADYLADAQQATLDQFRPYTVVGYFASDVGLRRIERRAPSWDFQRGIATVVDDRLVSPEEMMSLLCPGQRYRLWARVTRLVSEAIQSLEVAEGLDQARRGDLIPGEEVREKIRQKSRERRD